MGEWAGGKRVACALADSPLLRCLLGYRRSTPRKKVKHRNARQNHEASTNRTFKIVGEGVIEKRSRNQHKQRWNHGISPYVIRPIEVRLSPPENKYSAAGDHVEKPLRENRQRKELAEAASQQQKDNRQSALHNNRH
jgi:hypothetical protein